MDIFPNLFVVKIVMFVWKGEIKWKRGQRWPFFKNDFLWQENVDDCTHRHLERDGLLIDPVCLPIFVVGTATQLVILPPHIPHPIKRASRWYTVVMLLYDLCWWPCHIDNKWEGWEQITFSLAKLMTIMHIAFTGDNGRQTNGSACLCLLSIVFLLAGPSKDVFLLPHIP